MCLKGVCFDVFRVRGGGVVVLGGEWEGIEWVMWWVFLFGVGVDCGLRVGYYGRGEW